MRRWLNLILVTVVATVVVAAAVVGFDALRQVAPGSTPVAAMFGDQRIDLQTGLPPSPATVGVYEVSGPLSRANLREILPGRVAEREEWLTWRGDSDVPVRKVLRHLHPDIKWRVHNSAFGPSVPGQPDVTTGGMSPAFTGTDAVTGSFGRFLKEDGRLSFLSLPAVRIKQVREVDVITAEEALEQLRHHGPSATVLPTDVTSLPSRLAGQTADPVPPITAVRLVQAQDPEDPTVSKPVWVFDPVGEVAAPR